MILKTPQLDHHNPFLKKQNSLSKFSFFNPLKILCSLLIFSFFSLNIAQVKIKERIEIKPKQNNLSKTVSGDYFPCAPWIVNNDLYNPWQVVWINSSYHLDVGQQAFSFQDNAFDYRGIIDPTKNYDFTVIEGQDLCYINENYIDTLNGTYIPPTNTGYELLEVSGLDMIGELADGEDPLNLPRLQGVPTRGGFRKYTIYFKNPGEITFTIKESGTNEPTFYFHTLVVVPDFNLEYYGATELPHGEEDDINVREKAIQCDGVLDFWNGGSLTDEIKYDVSIVGGAEYGLLIKKTFDEDFLVTVRDTATSFSELDDTFDLLLAAQGNFPEDTATVKIRYATTDNNIPAIEQEVKIVKNTTYPLRVTLEPDKLMPGDTAAITLTHRVDTYPINDPTNVTYEPFEKDQLFNITIEKGSEFGTIYSFANEDTADSFSETTNGFSFISKDTINVTEAKIVVRASAFIDGETLPDSIENNETSLQKTSFIGIPVSGRDIFGIGNAKIGESGLDHFEITIIPDTLSDRDTIAFTETARIFVQAKDADSNNVELDSTKLLSFRVTTNTSFGTFISSNGDTLKTEPVILENITYADARTGKIKFAAVKENPDSILSCNIKISLGDDSTKNGNKEAVVIEQTLKIVMNGILEIRPNVSNINILANATLQNLQDYRKQFYVSLTRGGRQIGGHEFNIKTNYVDGSGGHDHRNFRRPITDENIKYWNYGHFRKTSTPLILANPITDTTNSDYLLGEYNYLSSRWGDVMKIILSSNEENLLTDTLKIIERIPDLNQLQPGENYLLIGGNNAHNGPPFSSEIDHNHFGTENTIRDIVIIANQWHNDNPDESTLRINDISLPNGGKFDVRGDWDAPHSSHREGQDVDIRTQLYFYDHQGEIYHKDGGIPVRTPLTEPFNLLYENDELRLNPQSIITNNDEFERICRENNFTANIHLANSTSEHYHLDYNNQN